MRGGERALAKVGVHRLPIWGGEAGKLVAEMLQREFEAGVEAAGVRDGPGKVGETVGHLARGFQAAFGVDFEPAAGGIECRMPAQAGERIGDDAVGSGGVGDAAGRKQRETLRGGEVAEKGDLAFLAADPVTLQFDEEPIAAEEREELFEGGVRGGAAGGAPRAPHGTVFVTGEGDEPGGIFFELGPRREAGTLAVTRIGVVGRLQDRRTAMGRTFGELRLGDELAKILVAHSCGDEERDDAAVLHGDLGADAGAEMLPAGRGVETRGAVEAVAIEHGDGGQFQPRGLAREVLGRRGPAQEAEGAPRVKFDVAAHGVQSYSPSMNHAPPTRSRR